MKLITYKILIPAVPFPYEGTVSAFNLPSAVAKIKHQAKLHGITVCRTNTPIEHEILRIREI